MREYAELYQPPFEKVLLVLPTYKFNCGHQIRHDTLSKALITAIEIFLKNLKKSDIPELNKGFKLTCQFCSERIYAPFQRFLPSLQSSFNSREWDLVQSFSFLFDGIPFKFLQTDQKIECFIGQIRVFSQSHSP